MLLTDSDLLRANRSCEWNASSPEESMLATASTRTFNGAGSSIPAKFEIVERDSNGLSAALP